MNFRAATNADRPKIETLVFSILRSYGLEPDPASTDADLADIEGFYHEDGGAFDLLLDEAGQIVGTVALHRTESDLCELRKMYLSPTMRGQGCGRKLLDHAIERARELGYPRMWLETATCLKEATKLYESYGFTPYEAPHISSRCDLALARDL